MYAFTIVIHFQEVSKVSQTSFIKKKKFAISCWLCLRVVHFLLCESAAHLFKLSPSQNINESVTRKVHTHNTPSYNTSYCTSTFGEASQKAGLHNNTSYNHPMTWHKHCMYRDAHKNVSKPPQLEIFSHDENCMYHTIGSCLKYN